MFVVASDDLEWSKKELNQITGETFHYSSECNHLNTGIESKLFDMALLSKGNHSIYDYGTYGFWCSYLAGGHTVLAHHMGNRTNNAVKNVKAAKLKNWHFIDSN